MKCQEWKGGENRRKLCSLVGRVSTLALILKCLYFLHICLRLFCDSEKKGEQACTTFISLNIRMLVHFLSSLAGRIGFQVIFDHP